MPFSLISHTWANFNEKKSAGSPATPRRGPLPAARTGNKKNRRSDSLASQPVLTLRRIY